LIYYVPSIVLTCHNDIIINRRKQAEAAIERELDTGADNIDFEGTVAQDTKDSAMGKGEAELYEKKLSKEEKKALAKAKREAKKKVKGKKGGGGDGEEKKEDDSTVGMSKSMSKMSMASMTSVASSLDPNSDEGKREAALEELSRQEIVVTYEQRKGNLHANTRDVNVGGVTVAFHGKTLIEETEVVINYGNRYGFIGPNGSGKVRGVGRVRYANLFIFCCANLMHRHHSQPS